MRRKITTWLLAASLLMAGCSAQNENSQPVVQEEPSVETAEELETSYEVQDAGGDTPEIVLEHYADPVRRSTQVPRMDGSTACLPLGRLLLRYFTGLSAADAERQLNFSGTYPSYKALSYEYNSPEILLVYEIDQDALRDHYQSNLEKMPEDIELESKAIGLDALVFLVNDQNPVTSLSSAQIQAIYRGEITNWSELGGADEVIVPFQRNEDSGSQTMMRKLLMGGDDFGADSPTRQVARGMGELVDIMADYDNGRSAIGYSVYYYAGNMYAVPGVRILAVDGVLPTPESIVDGSYPLTNEFYAVIRADAAENSAVRELYDFLTTEEGQELILLAGYQPVRE